MCTWVFLVFILAFIPKYELISKASHCSQHLLADLLTMHVVMIRLNLIPQLLTLTAWSPLLHRYKINEWVVNWMVKCSHYILSLSFAITRRVSSKFIHIYLLEIGEFGRDAQTIRCSSTADRCTIYQLCMLLWTLISTRGQQHSKETLSPFHLFKHITQLIWKIINQIHI